MCSLAVFVKKFLSFLQLRRIHVEVNGAGTGPWGWEDGVEGIADNTAADAVGAEHSLHDGGVAHVPVLCQYSHSKGIKIIPLRL